MDCPSCGRVNSDGRSRCGDCGTQLTIHCNACHARLPVGQKFCGECGAETSADPHVVSAEALAPARPFVGTEAERTPLTVMFCDLVGSTALSARLDPEELRNVMRTYQTCVADIIPRYDGITARFFGDGVLAYFGYPNAHEDDAEQAVRAALRLIEAIANLRTDEDVALQVRIGIATGEVVVGDAIGEGGAREQAIFGDTPNLAARLQKLAEPGTVVICANTRRLTGGYFEYRDLRPVELKGFVKPVPASQVLGLSSVRSRFDAQHHAGPTPLIGRDEETELLLRRWRHAEQGDGRVVLLTGEPGIGKSHIALDLQSRLQHEPHTTLRYFCSAHHANSALFPFISQLERAARIERGDRPEEKLDKLETLLQPSEDAAGHAVALVANLLSVPPTERSSLPDWSPQTRKEKTFEVLLAELAKLAAHQPLLLVFEDVHWIDPTSLALLALVVEQMPRHRAMLLITARPEFIPPWPGHSHVTTMPLTRLGPRDGATLVEQVTAGKKLPDQLMNQILARTDGVPLFVEELTKTVLESGLVQERDGNYVLDRPLPKLAIPTTLHASLVARLDRSAHARDLAHIGAAVGREFSYELLSTVAGYSPQMLEDALAQLVASGLVFCRGQIPQATYSFKHALVWDAAYAGLLKSRRVELHSAIAVALEEKFPELVQTEPETIAHHLAEAGVADKAVAYWLQAGRNAAGRSANLEAITHFRRGIEALVDRPDGPETNRLELDLQFALGPCLIATQGPASSEAVATFGRARELCDRLGEPPEYLQVPEYLNVMFWLATAGVVRGELPQALEATNTFIGMADARRDRPALLNATRGRAMVLLFMGQIAKAREELKRFIDTFDASAEADRQEAGRAGGQDPKAAGLALLSWALWLLGHEARALARIDEAVKRADALQHPHTRAYVYYYASILHALRKDAAQARNYAEQCFQLADRHGFRSWHSLSRAMSGITAQDPSTVELEEVQAALTDNRRAGYRFGLTVLYALLCPALLRAGRPEAALNVVDDGISTAENNSEAVFLSELYRQKAHALRFSAAVDAEKRAESLLMEALATSRQQSSRSLEFRTGRNLAGLWVDQGDSNKAIDLLASMLSDSVETLDTQDLEATRKMLDTLARNDRGLL